jgi:hypothetical protein
MPTISGNAIGMRLPIPRYPSKITHFEIARNLQRVSGESAGSTLKDFLACRTAESP